jgi:signal transduction histidine kinase/DNA-binding response OmpR family regulator
MENGKRTSVLIVDDESANIIALTHILSSEHNLYAATDGTTAIRLAKSHLPDVILLDIIMPDPDGYEVFNALRSDEDTKDIPIIFISGLVEDADEEKGLEMGAADYIFKPFRAVSVRMRVRNVVKLRDMRSSEEQAQIIEAEAEMIRKLENILNSIDTMIYATDADTDEILFISDSMKKHYGLGDVVGETCYKVFERGTDGRCSYCPCHKLDESPDELLVWEEYDTSRGRHYINTDRYIDWPGGTKAHLQSSVDITDYKRAQEELEQQSELNRILFENAPVGLTVFDENFGYIDCNEHILEMFGITRDFYKDFFGSAMHSPEFQPDGSPSHERAMEIIGRVMDGEKIKTEWLHCTPGGEPLPVELTMMRMRRGGRYVGLAYMYDMRKQVMLKNEMEAAMLKAREANSAKSIFLASMSHEIRTPMNVIMGVSEISLQDKSISPETEESFGKIYDAGGLLLNIINDLLDFSRIEAGKMELTLVNYDIPSLINDAVQQNHVRYESKSLKFELFVDKDTPRELYGDELRIKQILNNLLSNAFKYTDEGEVSLSVKAEPAADDDHVILVFRVSDTGQGMRQDQIERLFDEYSRFNLEKNRSVVGAGLGMSITKGLLDMMNGSIAVESEVGIGSVFTVRLPQKKVGSDVCGQELAERLSNFCYRSAAIISRSHIVHEHMPYGKVLLVDDVKSNLYVTNGLLKPYGLEVETATNGLEAIEKIKNGGDYDVVFMDHMMPVMDGIKATRIIRELGYVRPIVALTANAVVGQAEMFLQSGFDGFISKPIDSRELDAILKRLIRDKHPREEVEASRQGARQLAQGTVLTELAECFIEDAEGVIEVAERLYPVLRESGEAEIESYITAMHGIKSALASIGENEMSAFALRLEQAGKGRDFDVMAAETSVFLDELRALVARLAQGDVI